MSILSIKDVVEGITNCPCYDTYVTWFNRVFFVPIHVASFLLLIYTILKIFDRIFFARLQTGDGLFAFVSGCDSGFGHGAAYQLNDRGVHVFAACLTHEAVQRYCLPSVFLVRLEITFLLQCLAPSPNFRFKLNFFHERLSILTDT